MALVARSWPEVLVQAWPGAAWSLPDAADLGTLVWEGPGAAPSPQAIEAVAEAAWLATARARAAVDIDRQAEAERLEHITGGAGQAMVYLEKQREARSWLAAGDPQPEDHPLLGASVGVDVDPRTGGVVATVAQAAEVILLIATAWAATAAAIEGRRLRAKRAAAGAETVAAVEAAMAAEGWAAP